MKKFAFLLAVLAAASLSASVFGIQGEILGYSYLVVGASLGVAALLAFMTGMAMSKGVTELGRLG